MERGPRNNINFWSECDSITEETYNIATEFTTPEGRLLYDKIEGLDRETDGCASSSGGFLYLSIDLFRPVREDRIYLWTWWTNCWTLWGVGGS